MFTWEEVLMGRAKTGPCAPDVALDYPCSLSVLLLRFKSKCNPDLLRHWHLKRCGSTAGGGYELGNCVPGRSGRGVTGGPRWLVPSLSYGFPVQGLWWQCRRESCALWVPHSILIFLH